MRNFFVYLVILIAVLSMSAAGEKGTARNLLRVRGNMKKGKDKQCHQECKESKQCPQDKCSICREGRECSICREGEHSWKQCLPVCGEECKDKDDCPAECKECKGGVCSKPDTVGGDKQCHQECKESKQCPQDKCSICREGRECSICREGEHSWKQCLPVCGEECKDKDDCPAECKECKGGVCSKPDPHCNLGEIKVWHASPLMDFGLFETPFSSEFRRGPWCDGHKTGEVIVGGTCHKGFTRSIRTTVTPGDTNHVACGRFNDATHDVPASKWVVEDSPKSCKLKVPYCEHHCLHSNTCKVQIMEECTNPYE
eukprot:859969_1